jgi:ribosomal-protein-alanine N-acetyltransferase
MVARDVELLTPRLLIRAPERADYTAWAEGRRKSREHLERWEPLWPADALSKEDWSRRLRAWRGGWRDDRAYVFLIFMREGGKILGGVSITNVRRGPAQMGSLGYWLLEEAAGQGYMSEAVERVCHWCYAELGLARIEAGTLDENVRSQQVLERCGFEKEGRARAYLEIGGRRRDHILYARVLEDLRA